MRLKTCDFLPQGFVPIGDAITANSYKSGAILKKTMRPGLQRSGTSISGSSTTSSQVSCTGIPGSAVTL